MIFEFSIYLALLIVAFIVTFSIRLGISLYQFN